MMLYALFCLTISADVHFRDMYGNIQIGSENQIPKVNLNAAFEMRSKLDLESHPASLRFTLAHVVLPSSNWYRPDWLPLEDKLCRGSVVSDAGVRSNDGCLLLDDCWARVDVVKAADSVCFSHYGIPKTIWIKTKDLGHAF